MAKRTTPSRSIVEIILNIRYQLQRKGQNSGKNLLRQFQVADTDGSGFLERQELEELFTRSGIFLSKIEVNYLLHHFDSNY